MGTKERKGRERERREKQMLQAARRMLIKKGYRGLNMDHIAGEIEYSKGIVYQHFTSKEDLLAGIAADLLDELLVTLQALATAQGRSRELLTAAVMATERFLAGHPEYLRIRQVLAVPTLGEKAAPERRERLSALESQVMDALLGFVQRGVAEGALVFALPENGARVVLGVWAMVWGTLELEDERPGRSAFAGVGAEFAIQANCQAYLDGLGWRPLSAEVDYGTAGRRLLAAHDA
jgi:AcrR family transcriptional regulator